MYEQNIGNHETEEDNQKNTSDLNELKESIFIRIV